MVPGFHPFPFRTGKLSPAAPMVVRLERARVGSRRFSGAFLEFFFRKAPLFFLCMYVRLCIVQQFIGLCYSSLFCLWGYLPGI